MLLPLLLLDKFHSNEIMSDEINKTLSILQNGGVILYPTDTVWGLGCDATNRNAIQKIYEIKKRQEAKSMIILLPSAKDIFKYVANPHPDIVSIINAFEKPTTVIYSQAIGLPDTLVNLDGSIAIRIINEPFCKSLLKRFKKPIVSTSANISGEPTPQIFSAIDEYIKQEVDYVVDYRQQETTAKSSSTIVRVMDNGELEIIRG